jgi:hypothetical protein
MRSDLKVDPESDQEDLSFECEIHADDMNGVSNLSLPMNANAAQKQKLKDAFTKGGHVSGESTLKITGASLNDDELFLPPGLEIALEKKPKKNKRNLAVVTGDKPILVVKVTDSTGLARTESPTQIGDDIFGTNGDPVNLKSQLNGCSMGN